MSIIQLLFAGSGIFTKTNYYTSISSKLRVTVMPPTPVVTVDGESYLFTVPATTRSISVEMWGAGGASGSTRFGTSGNGGPGGYISAVIPISQIGATAPADILRLAVGGGGGATGGGDLNPAGSNDYYARPLDQFLEFNTSTIQHVASTSTSSNPTFSTVVPITGSTVSSVSNVSYSTISQVTSASSSNSTTYSTVTPVAGSSVSSVSSPTYNTVTHVASVSGTGVNSLTITPGILQDGDVILVSSVCATGQIPQNNPNTPTGYTILQNATVNGNVNYKLSYRRVTNTTADATIANLSASINDDNGDPFVVAHTVSIFRNVFGLGDPITSLNTNNTASTSIDPPQLNNIETPNYTTVAFGFLSGGSVDPVDINDPANYTRAVVQRVGTNVNAANEATTMVAYRSIPNSGSENPLAFTVPNPSSNPYVAITVGLMPTKTLSAISGSMTIPAAAGLVENDIVLVSSVSDGGTMSPPTNFSDISTAIGAVGRPAYSVSWKRIVAGDVNADGSVTINGLSTSGSIIGGQANGQPAGVAHYATAFRNVSTTANPSVLFTASTGTPTGNPDSPNIPSAGNLPSVNHAVLSFGFLNNRSLSTVTAPGGYTLLTNGVNTVGSDATGTTEATSMVAYTNLTTQLSENPGAFGVTGSGTGANYAAVTVALTPIRTPGSITGSMTLSGIQLDDIVLVSSVSDGGTMSPPLSPTGTNFTDISNVTGSNTSPAYRISWRRVTDADLVLNPTSYTITGLSLSGTVVGAGDLAGSPAGVAHYATVFRGVSTTVNPLFAITPTTPTAPTGNPNSPNINVTTSNYRVLSFGFLNNIGFPTVGPPAGYTQLSTLAISDGTPGTEATSMVAYRDLNTELSENPEAFSVTGINANQNYAAVTVALSPIRTLSAISGSMTIPAGVVQAGDVVLVSSVSDGPDPITGTMNLPSALGGSFLNISNSTGSPSYRVSWKRLSATDFDLTGAVPINGLSLSGTSGTLAAGVAHHATAFRGVDPNTAISPILTNATPASTGTGNPDPPTISPLSVANYTSVVFGFLNNNALPTVAPPTAPANYIQLSTLTVSDNTPGTEATSMVAYRASLGSGAAGENPGPFGVDGVGGENYAAVTVGLRPSPVAAAGDFSVLNLPPVQANDLIIVASVSDGGALSTPAGYTEVVTSQTGSNSPSYQISYKITNGTDVQVSGLSPGGAIDGGDNDGSPTAGVAHIASVYRGVSLTTPPAGFVAPNNNGNPNPPTINGISSGDGVVVFGFLDDISISDANITAPTTPAPGYTKTITRAVGTDNNGDNEASIMSAFKSISAGGNEDPGAFTVNGNDGRRNSAISIRLVPQVNARFSTATGSCGGSGGGYSGIFLLDGTPLMIAGGGGGGGGGTVYPFPQAAGGNGGSGGGINGLSGSLTVFDGVNFRLLGGPGGGGGATAGGAGGLTLLGVSGTPTTGNPGEAGEIYNSIFAGFYSGGRGANSPYNDLTSLPLQGANATGGWNKGAGGGSSRTDSFTTPVASPTDCGGGGGAGYYGGGGGGVGDGAGGGGGGGGSNYVDPRLSVSINSAGVGLLPAVTALPPSGNYIAGVGAGGASVVGGGVADVPGNPGGNGLIVLKYFE